jgi:hypothetical protein
MSTPIRTASRSASRSRLATRLIPPVVAVGLSVGRSGTAPPVSSTRRIPARPLRQVVRQPGRAVELAGVESVVDEWFVPADPLSEARRTVVHPPILAGTAPIMQSSAKGWNCRLSAHTDALKSDTSPDAALNKPGARRLRASARGVRTKSSTITRCSGVFWRASPAANGRDGRGCLEFAALKGRRRRRARPRRCPASLRDIRPWCPQ